MHETENEQDPLSFLEETQELFVSLCLFVLNMMSHHTALCPPGENPTYFETSMECHI